MIIDSNWDEITVENFINTIDEKTFYIWGASVFHSEIEKVLDGRKAKALIDKNPQKWGQDYYGYTISEPKESSGEIVISAVFRPIELIKQWKNLKYQKWFFLIDDDIYNTKLKKFVDFFIKGNRDYFFQNKNIKYLHIMPDQKFFLPILDILEKKYDLNEHGFIIYNVNVSNVSDTYKVWEEYARLSDRYKNITLLNEINVLNQTKNQKINNSVYKVVQNSKLIFFHGEWLNEYIFNFFVDKISILREKGIFIPWSVVCGTKDNGTYKYIDYLLKYCKVIWSEEDILYKNIISSFNYPMHFRMNNMIEDIYTIAMEKSCERNNLQKKVLVGSCCYAHEKSYEGIEKLKKYKGKISIYSVTSYGDNEAIKKTKEIGKKIFGNDFHAIDTYMSPIEYIKFISQMDVFICSSILGGTNNTRKIALLNGVKCYLRKSTNEYIATTQEGYHIYDYDMLENEDYNSLFDDKYREYNSKLAEPAFDIERKVQGWNKVLNLDIGKLKLKSNWLENEEDV